jgi:hypothetical protein
MKFSITHLPLPAILILGILMFHGCSKDNQPSKDSELKSFTGLVADNDTLYIGQKTLIRAIYEGKGVTFEWEASAGDLLGGGDQVEYLASFCAIGDNTITCVAKAAESTITKTIHIYVE